jgi:uncharacterized protein (TIGR02145 family)
MKTRLLTCLIILFPLLGFSQGEFNNWYFGSLAGITFNYGTPVPLLNCGLNGGWSQTCVSDSSGNLLFYGNYGWALNRNNNDMPHGSGLLGGAQTIMQTNFSVQELNDDSSYYYFTMGSMDPAMYTNGLRYSIINMRLDGGSGDIDTTRKNVVVPGATDASGALTGIRHHNNKDVWIVVRKWNNSGSQLYASYLITSSGLNTTPVYSNSNYHLPFSHFGNQIESIKISPDGTKMICIYDTSFEYCSFNSSTGSITPLFNSSLPIINNSGLHNPTDAEFSKNSKLLYISGVYWEGTTLTYIFQFDATQTDSLSFLQSGVILGQIYQSSSGLQRGPDDKIYGTKPNKDSLTVIQYPNIAGTGCQFVQNFVSLQGRASLYNLPQYLEKYKAYIHHSNLCQNDSVHFSGDIWPLPDSTHWDFGDPGSGINNYSTLNTPSHVYSNVGTYTVTLFVRHNDNRTDTSWQTITIVASPQVVLGADRTICIGDSTTFDAGACNGCTYLWKNIASGDTVGTSQTFRTGQAGTYAVIVTNSNNCTGSDTVQLFTTPVPSVTNNPLSKTICSGDSTDIALTSSVPGTMFHWTANLTSGNISGFSADSGLILNQILIDNLPTPGVVTYHITPKVGSCVGITADYQVTVTPGDSVKVSITPSANNVCAGTSVTYTAIPTYGGANPAYQWKVNGTNSGTNSSTFTYTPANNDVVTCVLTSSITTCISNNPATSNAITMTVNPLLPVSVNVAPSLNPVCAGTSVTFTATPTNGGLLPSYQWKVNSINVGTNSSTYSYIPANGDLVSCILTSSATCTTNNPASSIQYPVSVSPNLPAGITIAASSNPFCPGSSVTFNATPINGGTTPTYQWKVNGVNAGTNSATFTYNPVNNDSVRCVMTSDLGCVTGNPASSLEIIMSGTLAPIVTFTACFDTITTINAKPIKLKGGIPLGGTYSGPGVNSLTGVFDPATAGVGTKTITYTYTNAVNCTSLTHAHIINYPLSIINCGTPFTDIRDNKVYQTVQIGSQCWMAEDLNYGTEIPVTQDQRDNCIPEKYSLHLSPLTTHSFYQWDELMLYDNTPADQGFCPPAWHIPTENDWNTLFATYINNGFAGSPLKYSGYSGFNALLSGARHINKSWDFQGFATFFWSSTLRSSTQAWAHGMNDPDPSVSVYPASRANAFSVRCLHD